MCPNRTLHMGDKVSDGDSINNHLTILPFTFRVEGVGGGDHRMIRIMVCVPMHTLFQNSFLMTRCPIHKSSTTKVHESCKGNLGFKFPHCGKETVNFGGLVS